MTEPPDPQDVAAPDQDDAADAYPDSPGGTEPGHRVPVPVGSERILVTGVYPLASSQRRPVIGEARPPTMARQPAGGHPGPRSGQAPGGSRPDGEGHNGRPRIDPRFVERWVRVRREQGRHRLRLLLVATAIVVVVILAVGVLYSPLLNVRHIRITGPPAVSRQELLAIAGLSHPRPLIDIDAGKVAARLDAVPTLGGARVGKHWPATLDITVVARTPIAAVPRPVPAGSISAPGWVTVDATGRVLADVVAAAGLPVVQGTGEVPPPGGWLEGSAGPRATPPARGSTASLADLRAAPDSPAVPGGAAAALAIVGALPPALRAQVLSVSVAPGNQLRMAVLPATVASGAISVNLGDGSRLAAKLTALATLLAQANLSGVAQIDLTVPDRPATLTAR